MKILIITKFLYPKGGDSIVALNTGKLLRSHGNDVIFWGMQHTSNAEFSHSNFFVDNINLNEPDEYGFIEQLSIAFKVLYSFEAKHKIRKLIAEIGRPDIVHLHNFAHQISPSILHVFKELNIPCVMTMHDYKLVCSSYSMLVKGRPCDTCKNGKHYYCFIRKCIKNSSIKSFLGFIEMFLHHSLLHIYDTVDIYISPSRFLKEKVVEMGFLKKIEYLPNFIDLNEYVPLNDDTTDKYIIYLGRLSKEKGLITLVNAMKGLDIVLKIIGDGPFKEEVYRESKRLNLGNIKFLGHLSGDELKDTIRKSLFLVLPSEWYENNPRSIIEAFALKKPVVGARIGGIPELVIDNVTGLTFEPRNVGDLRKKIIALAVNPQDTKRMGRNARQFVEVELDNDKHYERLMSIYHEAIAKHQE